MKKSPLNLEKDQKQRLVEELISYIDEEWDQEIGLLKAELLLDFMTEKVGKELYNLGISHSRNFIMKKMEDMELDMDQLRL